MQGPATPDHSFLEQACQRGQTETEVRHGEGWDPSLGFEAVRRWRAPTSVRVHPSSGMGGETGET